MTASRQSPDAARRNAIERLSERNREALRLLHSAAQAISDGDAPQPHQPPPHPVQPPPAEIVEDMPPWDDDPDEDEGEWPPPPDRSNARLRLR